MLSRSFFFRHRYSLQVINTITWQILSRRYSNTPIRNTTNLSSSEQDRYDNKTSIDKSIIGILKKNTNGCKNGFVNSECFGKALLLMSKYESSAVEAQMDFLERFLVESGQSDLFASFLLQRMIVKVEHPSKIFEFIVSNEFKMLNNGLLEIFLYRIIQNESLNLATALLHFLFSQNLSSKFVMSNQLWSLFISKVCELAHYSGACLIYNDILYNSYFQDVYLRRIDGNAVPFLVTPGVLKQLGYVLMQSGDHERVSGLIRFFKNSYSYMGHAETYKSLTICLIEALSKSGNFEKALGEFNRICYSLKGHKHNLDLQKSKVYSKIVSLNNYRWRRKNIQQNINRVNLSLPMQFEDKVSMYQREYFTSNSLNPFSPASERNVYAYPSSRRVPIIEGTLSTNDLPCFSNLLKKNIKKLKDQDMDISFDIYSSLLSKNHYLLFFFLVKSLCELGYLNDALKLMQMSQVLYPTLRKEVSSNPDGFKCLLNACIKNIEYLENNDNTKQQKHKILEDTYYVTENAINAVASNIFKEITYSNKLSELLIRSLLHLPSTEAGKIHSLLDRILGYSRHRRFIHLTDFEMAKLRTIIDYGSGSYNPKHLLLFRDSVI